MATDNIFTKLERAPTNEDWFLQTMVVSITIGDTEMPITITTKGTIITGTLISVRRYYYLYAESLPNTASTTEEIRNFTNLRNTYSEIGAEFSEKIKNWYESNPESGLRLIKYIHLTDAKFVAGGILAPRSGRGLLWRGKISEVDGFSFGALQSSSSNISPRF